MVANRDEFSPASPVWRQYSAEPLPALRDKIIVAFEPSVRRTAHKLSEALAPQSVLDEDDLAAEGLLALPDAIQRYDPATGILFYSFAQHAVRGRMLDAIRAADPVSRLARRRQKLVQIARDAAAQELGRQPTHDEIAGRLEDPAIAATFVPETSSIHRQRFANEQKIVEEIDLIEDPGPRPDSDVAAGDDFESIIGQIRDDHLKLVCRMRFVDDLELRLIAGALGLSESRVSQMLAQALAILKRSRVVRRMQETLQTTDEHR